MEIVKESKNSIQTQCKIIKKAYADRPEDFFSDAKISEGGDDNFISQKFKCKIGNVEVNNLIDSGIVLGQNTG